MFLPNSRISLQPDDHPPFTNGQARIQRPLMRRLYWRIWLVTIAGMLVFAGLILAAWVFSHPSAYEQAQNRVLLVKDTNGYVLFTVPMLSSVQKTQESLEFAVALNSPLLWNEPFFYLELPPLPPPLTKWGGPAWLTSVPLFLGLFGLAFLLLALLMLPFVRRLLRRLEGLQTTVATWGNGDLSVRAKIRGNDEVAFLASEFNQAATRIQKLLQTHKSLLANASHELRSPLTRLRLRLELSSSSLSEAEQAEIVRNLNELDQLIEEILLSSRLDNPDATLPEWEHIDLAGLLAEECARVEAALQAQNCVVQGSPKLLRRLLRNLLENAKHYGGSAGTIQALVASDPSKPDWALVRICDDGPGVPTELQERIFEPFFRLPGASEKEGGVGLGLALVRSIARHHGGTVVCCTRPDGKSGACFEVCLPTALAKSI